MDALQHVEVAANAKLLCDMGREQERSLAIAAQRFWTEAERTHAAKFAERNGHNT